MIVKKEAINGAIWTSIATLIISISQVLRLSILARYLDKSDFGLVAIIGFVLGLTQVFGDLGFSVAIIHKNKVSIKEFNSVYWAQFFLYLLLYVALFFSSKIVADFYNDSFLQILIPIAGLDIIFWGVGKLYDTLLQKQLKFKTIAIRNIISSFLSLLVAFFLAILDFGVYSLIFSTLFYSAFNNIWNFIAGQNSIKINFHFSLSEVKQFFSIGIYKTGAQILDYFSGKVDILIIGKILGPELLGVYNLAKEIVIKIIAIFQIISSKVSLPLFAKYQNDLSLLKGLYVNLISLITFIVFPICAFLLIFSKLIVFYLYGSNYYEVAGIMPLFAILIMINSISSPEGIIASSTGNTKLDFHWTIIRVILTTITVIITSFISINSVVIGQIIVSLFGFYYVWKYIIYKIINLEFPDYIKSFFKSFVLAIITILILYCVVNGNYFNIKNELYQLVVYGLLFISVYIVLLSLIMKKDLHNYKKLFLK